MPKYRLLIEYDGTDFSGWQYQPGARTVQEEIEKAIAVFSRERTRVTAAGRTDAGVHAAGQVASFSLEKVVDPSRLRRALNGIMPGDVRVMSAAEAGPDFDARRSATGKTYRYLILNRPSPPALGRGFVLHHPYNLDVAAMSRAATTFEGEHDFSAFRASDCESAHAVRHIFSCTVAVCPPSAFGLQPEALVAVEVTATAFLKNMVRVMVGTLLEIGNGRRTAESVADALLSGRRDAAGVTAPAHGLFLHKVFYGAGLTDGVEWAASGSRLTTND